MQGVAGPLTLRVEASLEEVEDPVASQIKALHAIVQPLKVSSSSILVKNSSYQWYDRRKKGVFYCTIFSGGV